MNVGVYSLKNVLFQGEAKSINCKTRAGEITILDNHRPLIGILESGAIKIADEKGEKREIFISSGFLEVRRDNSARCIVDE
ncbi:MAG: hypothetical protein AAB846_00540 [Patescibacteria group bacterium]